MKKILRLILVVCGLAFVSNVFAQIQGNKTDKVIGFYDPVKSADGTLNITTIDWNTTGVDGQKYSLNNAKGISGVSWTLKPDGLVDLRTPVISGNFWRAVSNTFRSYRFMSIASFNDSIKTNTTGFVSATASYDSIINNKANLILNIPGAPLVKYTDVATVDTMVADQAIAFWPGKATNAAIDIYFSLGNALANLNSDISFDILTMDGGNSGDQINVKMIVSTHSEFGGGGSSSDWVENLNTIATVPGKVYVVDNIFNTAANVVGEASRKRINICQATGLTPAQIRAAGKIVIRLVYSSTSGGNLVSMGATHGLMYAPIIGVDNIYCESAITQWIYPETLVAGATGGVTANEKIPMNVDLYIGEETPVKIKLKDKNRLGAMKIIVDSPLNTAYYFKATGCVKAADANGKYTIDVPYNIEPVTKDAITIEHGKITIPANADGTAADDDLEVTLYGYLAKAGSRTVSIEVDNSVRFWIQPITGTGVERKLSDKKIVFVTGNDKDSVQYNWLVGNGAQVIKLTMTAGISTARATLLDTIKAADLIIIGRSPASSTIQAVADKDAWNALSNPIILNSQYIARNSRINWFNSATINTKDVLGKATLQAPTDAVFSKVTPVNNMIEWSIPKNDILDSVKQTNGTVLATYENVTTSPLFVRFAANTAFYEGTTDKPAGPRTYFGFGNDASGVVNFFPLPVDAQKVYWAEILRILGLPIAEPTKYYIVKSSDATLSAITLSAGELKPAFSANVTSYSVNLPTGSTALTITSTATSSKAIIAGAGAQTFTKDGKTANIVVTAEDGTTKTYTVAITVGVGVNDLSMAGIRMYPNPAKEYINLSGMKTNAAYSVFNAQGKQMDAGIATGSNAKLNLAGYDAGIYLIRVDMNGQVYNSRFVKQ